MPLVCVEVLSSVGGNGRQPSGKFHSPANLQCTTHCKPAIGGSRVAGTKERGARTGPCRPPSMPPSFPFLPALIQVFTFFLPELPDGSVSGSGLPRTPQWKGSFSTAAHADFFFARLGAPGRAECWWLAKAGF